MLSNYLSLSIQNIKKFKLTATTKSSILQILNNAAHQ